MASGLTAGGSVWLSTLQMDTVNGIIETYNLANEASIGALRVGVGGQAEVRMPLGKGGVASFLGVRAALARAASERETVLASLVGTYVGVSYGLGSWSGAIDIGAYRGGFEFPVGRYKSLVGWDVGLVARLSYSLQLLRAVEADVALISSWLPTTRLTDAEGGLYEARGGSFLDCSGVGFSIGVSWGF
jgi:hypothetical protein